MSSMRGLPCLVAVFLALPLIGCGENPSGPDAGLDAAGSVGLDAQEPGLDAGQEPDTGAEPGPDAATPADASSPYECTLTGHECAEGKECRLNWEDWNFFCGVAGDVAVGQPCTIDPDNCAAGLACEDLDGSGPVCWKVCSTDPSVPCADTHQICVSLTTSVGGLCVGDDCTPAVGGAGTGCPSGRQCDVYAGKVFACVPIGSAAAGASCKDEYCQAGNHCDSTGYGYFCAPFCTPSSTCSPEGTRCLFPWYEAGIQFGLCQETECDPVTSGGCETGEGCYYLDAEEGTFACWEGGPLVEGADCSSMLDLCAPGHDCFAVDGTEPDYEYRCFQYCDDAHPTCTGTKTCTASSRVVGAKLCK